MKAPDLLTLIKSPHQINPTAITKLNQVLERYPYFQLAYTLVAKIKYDEAPQKALKAIQLASLYATDRKQLKLLLENKLSYRNLVNHSATVKSPQTNDSGKSKTCVVPPAEAHQLEVDLQKTSLISDRTGDPELSLIDKLITHPPRKIKIKNDEESLSQHQGKDFVEESVYSYPRLFTETLATIMLKQDKFEKALEIYQKLKVKFPEKSTYFESLIAQIPKPPKANK